MRKRLTESELQEIKLMFTRDMKPLREIAKQFELSAMGVKKALNRMGIKTSKESLNYSVRCTFCNTEFSKHRFRVRKSFQNFCSRDCYFNHLNLINEENVVDRSGQAVSRRKMEKVFGPLPEGSIVHHIDGNDRNVLVTNLMLLVSQKDHILVHRRVGNPSILFDGEKLKQIYPNLTDLQIEQKLGI